MPPKNKGIKMSLDSFLQDESLGGGSWADDDVDFNTIQIPVTNKFSGNTNSQGQPNPRDPAFGGLDAAPRRDRVEYPIPDAPPYRAILSNLSWEASEESIADWLIDYLKAEDAVLKIVAPKDHNDPSRLKGFAFVTLNTREQLEKSLQLSATELQGRRVFVSVAQPERESSFGSRRGQDSGVDLDWGSARGSGSLPPREQREQGEQRERRPRREEPDLDWGSARGSGVLPPREEREHREQREPREQRERKPRREEPDLDWGSARGSGVLPPREHREPREQREPRERKPRREEPDLDWGSARGSGVLPPRRTTHHANKTTAADKENTWARGQSLPSRSTNQQQSKDTTTEEAKPVVKKSVFSVLATEDDDEEEATPEVDTKPTPKDDVDTTELEQATKSLTVEETSGEGWEVVGKK